MGWVMDLLSSFRRPPLDSGAVRDEMTRDDPSFRHVREVQHDALNALAGSRGIRQVRDRFNEQLRDSWRPNQ